MKSRIFYIGVNINRKIYTSIYKHIKTRLKEKVLRYIPQDRQYTVNRLNSATEEDLQSYQPAFVETMSENGYWHLILWHLILLNIVE